MPSKARQLGSAISAGGALAAGTSTLPIGTTAERPASPTNGTMRINSTTNYIEVYYNSNWLNLQYIGTVVATGGTVSVLGGYKYHLFTTSGVFTASEVPSTATFDVIVVGGGGAGGGS